MKLPLTSRFFEALSGQGSLEGYIQRRRDLVILEILDGYTFVLACDSNASIGLKEHDYVRHSWKEVGRSAAKVPLMEVLAVGAFPFIVVDNLCVEPEPSGAGILEGIRFEVERLGLDPDLVVTGSAEKNMITTQTGLGVTVLGIAPQGSLRLGTSQPGDMVACVGIPKNAPERPYEEGDPEIMDPPATKQLRSLEFIHEILPVGSHGIAYEMGVLAADSHLVAREVDTAIPTRVSAGASTCVLASLPVDCLEELKTKMNKPVNLVGWMEMQRIPQ
jgi:selenophosphate synthetase-related protein